MKKLPEIGSFTPTSTRVGTKNEATNKVARDMIDNEVAARVAKTERLRAARLAREAAEPQRAAVVAKKATKKR